MTEPSSHHLDAARELLAHAAPGGDALAAALGVYEGLAGVFVPLLGNAGFGAVFARSLRFSGVARQFVECAEHGRIDDYGKHLDTCLRDLEAPEVSLVATRLYAAFFALLSTFIGEVMVWQMVQKAFPASRSFGIEEKN